MDKSTVAQKFAIVDEAARKLGEDGEQELRRYSITLNQYIIFENYSEASRILDIIMLNLKNIAQYHTVITRSEFENIVKKY